MRVLGAILGALVVLAYCGLWVWFWLAPDDLDPPRR